MFIPTACKSIKVFFENNFCLPAVTHLNTKFLLSQKKKKAGNNAENQQWEQWKQKDIMVMYKLFLVYRAYLPVALKTVSLERNRIAIITSDTCVLVPNSLSIIRATQA